MEFYFSANGANEWTRTTDLGVMNPVLSPAELHWHISFNMVAEV